MTSVGVEHDRNGLEILDEIACLELLRRHSVGRIAVTIGALPAIFPVNYTMLDDDIVFRTGTGAKLAAAVRNTVVAFQIDEFDAIDHSGWRVLVTGRSEEIMRPDELERAR